MIRKSVIPSNQDILLHVPKKYIGKKVEILLYAVDELMEEVPQKNNSIARFKGVLSSERADEFQKAVQNDRSGWENDI